MPRRSHTYLLIMMMACLMVTVAAMMTAVIVATQRPTIVVVQSAPGAPGGAGAAAAPAAAATPAPPAPQVVAVRVPAAPTLDDPYHPAWDRIKAVELPLQAQQVAQPMLDQATVPSLSVQALHDEKAFVWRLSWAAAKRADQVDAGEFGDAVALQFPLVEGTPFTMGAKGKPVRILHWKAVWQRDVDQGFQDITDHYPNAWSDLYWFAEGKPPFKIRDGAFKSDASRQWLVGFRAGNPMSDFLRTEPVEEITAEGIGTATHLPSTDSAARGAWKDGKWTVLIRRTLVDGDSLSTRLKVGGEQPIAFAVWDGSAGNVGSRKHWAGWLTMRIEP